VLVLGIDTAGRNASVALVDGDGIGETRERVGPHSATLLPVTAELLRDHGARPEDLDLIGVSRGPGSYTGLRVGVVSAKTLGWATRTPVVGVPTLEARARLAPGRVPRVLVALHAYKKRMLYQWFTRGRGDVLEPEAVPALVQAAEVPRAGAGEAVVTDAPELLDGIDSWRAEVVVPLGTAAQAVAALALARWRLDARDEACSLTPVYLRPPPVTLKPGGFPHPGAHAHAHAHAHDKGQGQNRT
jgi:tRNA threonylcarbamoyladenosine biosynthesis protein TsaB